MSNWREEVKVLATEEHDHHRISVVIEEDGKKIKNVRHHL